MQLCPIFTDPVTIMLLCTAKEALFKQTTSNNHIYRSIFSTVLQLSIMFFLKSYLTKI